MDTVYTLTDDRDTVKIIRTVVLDIAPSGCRNGPPKITYTIKAGGRKFSIDGSQVQDVIDGLDYLKDFSDTADDNPDYY